MSFTENYFSPGILDYHIEIYHLFQKVENYSLDLRALGTQTKRKRRQHLQIFATVRPHSGEIGTEETRKPPWGLEPPKGVL